MNHNHKRLMSLMLLLAMALYMAVNIRAADAPYCGWKQYDARWAGQTLNKKTMREVGCLATSVAMLAVQAGLKSESDFDPGIFAAEMRGVGGFTASDDLIWEKVPLVVPGFTAETPWAELKGTQHEKAAKLRSWQDQGYFVAIAVKNGGHWVALRGVSSGVVTMMDPGGTATCLFERYAAGGVTRAALFRAPKKAAAANTQGNTEFPAEPPAAFKPWGELDLLGLLGDWCNRDMAESCLAFLGDVLNLLWKCVEWAIAFVR